MLNIVFRKVEYTTAAAPFGLRPAAARARRCRAARGGSRGERRRRRVVAARANDGGKRPRAARCIGAAQRREHWSSLAASGWPARARGALAGTTAARPPMSSSGTRREGRKRGGGLGFWGSNNRSVVHESQTVKVGKTYLSEDVYDFQPRKATSPT